MVSHAGLAGTPNRSAIAAEERHGCGSRGSDASTLRLLVPWFTTTTTRVRLRLVRRSGQHGRFPGKEMLTVAATPRGNAESGCEMHRGLC